jgi:hypothetical protein
MSGSTPDITSAQVLAVLTGIVTQLVNAGFVDGRTEQLVVGLAGILVPFAWIIGDAIIRHGRSRALIHTPRQ